MATAKIIYRVEYDLGGGGRDGRDVCFMCATNLAVSGKIFGKHIDDIYILSMGPVGYNKCDLCERFIQDEVEI
jgi:hypothetical protein